MGNHDKSLLYALHTSPTKIKQVRILREAMLIHDKLNNTWQEVVHNFLVPSSLAHGMCNHCRADAFEVPGMVWWKVGGVMKGECAARHMLQLFRR